MENKTIPNWVRDFKGFIQSCGVYVKNEYEDKFICEVLNIKPSIPWNSSKKPGAQKRKFLICMGSNNWKYTTISKDNIPDELNYDDFKSHLHDAIKERE